MSRDLLNVDRLTWRRFNFNNHIGLIWKFDENVLMGWRGLGGAQRFFPLPYEMKFQSPNITKNILQISHWRYPKGLHPETTGHHPVSSFTIIKFLRRQRKPIRSTESVKRFTVIIIREPSLTEHHTRGRRRRGKAAVRGSFPSVGLRNKDLSRSSPQTQETG